MRSAPCSQEMSLGGEGPPEISRVWAERPRPFATPSAMSASAELRWEDRRAGVTESIPGFTLGPGESFAPSVCPMLMVMVSLVRGGELSAPEDYWQGFDAATQIREEEEGDG